MRSVLGRGTGASLLFVAVLVGVAFSQAGFVTPTIRSHGIEMKLDLQRDELRGTIQSLAICPADPLKVALMVTQVRERSIWILDTGTGDRIRVKSSFEEEEDILGPLKAKDHELDWRPQPDSKGRNWFAFVGLGDTGEPGIFAGWFGGARTYRIVDGLSGLGWLRWSPDGDRIAFHASALDGKGGRLYLVTGLSAFLSREDPSGVSPLQVRQLTDYLAYYPSWSPDGKYLAFSAETGDIDMLYGRTPPTMFANWAICVMDPKKPKPTTAVITIDLTETDEFRPTWSPDGDYIAFHLSREQRERDSAQKGDAEGAEVRTPGLVKSTELQVVRLIEEDCRIVRSLLLEGTFSLERNLLVDGNRGPIWGPAGTYTIYYIPASGSILEGQFVHQPIRYCRLLPWIKEEGKESYDLPVITDPQYCSSVEVGKGGRIAFATMEGVSSRLYTATLTGEDLLPLEQQSRDVSQYADWIGRRVDAACRNCWKDPFAACFWYRGPGIVPPLGIACCLAGICCEKDGDGEIKDLVGTPPYPAVPGRMLMKR